MITRAVVLIFVVWYGVLFWTVSQHRPVDANGTALHYRYKETAK